MLGSFKESLAIYDKKEEEYAQPLPATDEEVWKKINTEMSNRKKQLAKLEENYSEKLTPWTLQAVYQSLQVIQELNSIVESQLLILFIMSAFLPLLYFYISQKR